VYRFGFAAESSEGRERGTGGTWILDPREKLAITQKGEKGRGR
jgi:hypothetical protein